jgi:hypothetical protein
MTPPTPLETFPSIVPLFDLRKSNHLISSNSSEEEVGKEPLDRSLIEGIGWM